MNFDAIATHMRLARELEEAVTLASREGMSRRAIMAELRKIMAELESGGES